MGLSQSNRSGSDANEYSIRNIEVRPVLNGNTNTQINVMIVGSSHGSSLCQQPIMKGTAQGESNRTDGGVVCQAAGCGCALTEASPELGCGFFPYEASKLEHTDKACQSYTTSEFTAA